MSSELFRFSNIAFAAVSTDMQCYTRVMIIMATAVLAITFSVAMMPIPSVSSDAGGFSTVVLQVQSNLPDPSVNTQQREQRPDLVASPTRVWRYVIIGSAVVLVALIGVLVGFRFKNRSKAGGPLGS